MKELVKSYLEQTLYKKYSGNELKIDYLNNDFIDDQDIQKMKE